MAIRRAPLKTDAAGKCSRWRVILYNPATHKQEWHTVGGTRRDAEAFERQQKTRLASGVYIARTERRTFAQVVDLFLKEFLGDRRLPRVKSNRLPMLSRGLRAQPSGSAVGRETHGLIPFGLLHGEVL